MCLGHSLLTCRCGQLRHPSLNVTTFGALRGSDAAWDQGGKQLLRPQHKLHYQLCFLNRLLPCSRPPCWLSQHKAAVFALCADVSSRCSGQNGAATAGRAELKTS